ncbi:hypothetical protein GW17_00058409 [Ensete ventricosum]|nr:hypothetical protein GW17_00058409 [Ensete ventricosum]
MRPSLVVTSIGCNFCMSSSSFDVAYAHLWPSLGCDCRLCTIASMRLSLVHDRQHVVVAMRSCCLHNEPSTQLRPSRVWLLWLPSSTAVVMQEIERAVRMENVVYVAKYCSKTAPRGTQMRK